jgi:cytochrome c553
MSDSPPFARSPRLLGEQARERIRAAIRARREARQSAPTIAQLVSDTGLSETDVRHHVKWMANQRPPQVRIDPARPSSVVLLDEARP